MVAAQAAQAAPRRGWGGGGGIAAPANKKGWLGRGK